MDQYLVQLGNFEQRIDIHSAYHVMSGDWHDSFVQFEKDLLTWVPSESNASNLWLRDYINATLSSTEYVSKFGEIPYLVGSEYMGKFTILDKIVGVLQSFALKISIIITLILCKLIKEHSRC